MWYFTWTLGLAAALSLGVINALWYEAERAFERTDGNDD
jgi:cyd operon protein YbgT